MMCNVLVISQVECIRVLAQAFVVSIDGTHEEAQGLGCISGAPFLSGFFLFDAD